MNVKDLRNGKFLRCYNNDVIDLNMNVHFINTSVIEPYLELSMDNIINLPIKILNENYNLMKGTFSSPLTNNENPIKITLEYTCYIEGEELLVIQEITNNISMGVNRIDLLDIYTNGESSLRSIIGDSNYEIVGDFKLNGHLKKLPQIQIPYLDFVLISSPFYSNITIIS